MDKQGFLGFEKRTVTWRVPVLQSRGYKERSERIGYLEFGVAARVLNEAAMHPDEFFDTGHVLDTDIGRDHCKQGRPIKVRLYKGKYHLYVDTGKRFARHIRVGEVVR